MNKIVFITFLTFFLKISEADEIKTFVILQNCNVCHTQESQNLNSMKSLKSLEKKYFLTKMYKYKKENDNSVMNRVLEPINILDIVEMADYLYGE